jgi:hypothetical protein
VRVSSRSQTGASSERTLAGGGRRTGGLRLTGGEAAGADSSAQRYVGTTSANGSRFRAAWRARTREFGWLRAATASNRLLIEVTRTILPRTADGLVIQTGEGGCCRLALADRPRVEACRGLPAAPKWLLIERVGCWLAAATNGLLVERIGSALAAAADRLLVERIGCWLAPAANGLLVETLLGRAPASDGTIVVLWLPPVSCC